MLTFVGDYLPNRPFSTLACIQGDCLVANLEAAIGGRPGHRKRKAHPIVLTEDAFSHILNSGVAAFNLANNHVYDAGPAAFDRMHRFLADLDRLQVYGTKESPFCEIRYAGLRVFLIGCVEPCRARGPRLFRQEDVTALIRTLRRYADRVYVTPHWGKESELTCYPSPAQLRLAREWIHTGVDGVFGHHPHAIHGCEDIDGKPVYYSLGNYQFDHVEGRAYPVTEWGLAVRVNPSAEGDEVNPVFLRQTNGIAIEADAFSTSTLSVYLDRISKTITDPMSRWTTWKWATNVGPTYLKKSRMSWRRRFHTDGVTALPLWLAWSFLPRTLLMRLAAICSRDQEQFPVARLSRRCGQIATTHKQIVDPQAARD